MVPSLCCSAGCTSSTTTFRKPLFRWSQIGSMARFSLRLGGWAVGQLGVWAGLAWCLTREAIWCLEKSVGENLA